MLHVRAALALPVLAVALAAGCAPARGGGPAGQAPAASTTAARSPSAGPATHGAGTAPSATPPAGSTPAPTPADPARVRANELGLVPVLMYHQILAHPAGVYDQTPQHFRAELETLAREGYVPVTAAQFATGRMDVPAGRHPVVLTFDDGTTSQMALDAAGRPRPGTAVAILEQVAREHPGFTATATFFVNARPFADPSGRAVRWLHAHGYEVAAHTVSHANLRQLSDAAVQQQIGGNVAMIESMIPGYRPVTFALPFGVLPRTPALDHRGASGGAAYDFAGVFLVGSNPAPSPFSRRFDPYAIPRIRSEAASTAPVADRPFISDTYLAWLQKHPALRYTSDGDPDRIAFPRAEAGSLAPRYRDRGAAY